MQNLARVVKAYREYYGISFRDWAAEVDCDHTLLLALERGKGLNAVAFVKILVWLVKS